MLTKADMRYIEETVAKETKPWIDKCGALQRERDDFKRRAEAAEADRALLVRALSVEYLSAWEPRSDKFCAKYNISRADFERLGIGKGGGE